MDRLAELRERRALTLRELAEMSGVAADTINQIELGHRKARPSTLRKLAKALGVEIRELFEEPTLSGKAEAPEAGPANEQDPSPPPSREVPEDRGGEERREELRMFRELLTDAHGLLEEMANEYKVTGATDKLTTLASVAMFSVMGAEQFVQEEVGPAEDRASTRVYAAGARLEEFVEDLLETIQSTTTEPVGGEVAYLDALRRRRAG